MPGASHLEDIQYLGQKVPMAFLLEAEQPQPLPSESLGLWLLLNEHSLLMLIELEVNETGLFYRA